MRYCTLLRMMETTHLSHSETQTFVIVRIGRVFLFCDGTYYVQDNYADRHKMQHYNTVPPDTSAPLTAQLAVASSSIINPTSSYGRRLTPEAEMVSVPRGN